MKKVVRIIGVILCVAAGIAMTAGIIGTTQVGSCGDFGEQVCPASVGTDVFQIIGGAFALTIGAIMTMGVGVLFACLSAAVTLIVQAHSPVPKIIAIVLIAVPGIILLITGLTARATTSKAIGMANFKAHARMVPAVVASVRDTGVSVNDNPRVLFTVVYQRDDGTEATVEQRSVVSRVAIPRPGDRATVWYDPAGPKVLMELGEPTPEPFSADAYTADMLNAAGMTAAASAYMASAPFQSSEPEDAMPGSGADGAPALVSALERLAALHRNGSLNDDEYTLAKQRLLNGP